MVSIRIADGKKIVICCLHFFIFISLLLSVLQPALLCMLLADSAGNIAAGALIQTNTLSYCIFGNFSVFRGIPKGR